MSCIFIIVKNMFQIRGKITNLRIGNSSKVIENLYSILFLVSWWYCWDKVEFFRCSFFPGYYCFIVLRMMSHMLNCPWNFQNAMIIYIHEIWRNLDSRCSNLVEIIFLARVIFLYVNLSKKDDILRRGY